jgi:hypothetical protein
VPKFKLSAIAIAVTAGVILTSGSVASWSIPGGAVSQISSDALNSESTTPESAGSISDPQSISATESFDGGSLLSEVLYTGSPTPESRLANLVLDPDAGGSPEVVYPDPSEREQLVVGKAPAPANFRVTALGDDFVSLAFTTSPNISLYQVYVRYEDSFSSTGVGSSGVVTFRDLAPDFDYVACVYYRVDNVESNLACLDIHTTGTRPVEPVRAPAPTNIELSATETTLTASWDAVPGAQWYRLCHVSGDSSWQCGGYTMLGATQAVFQDGSISKATRYGITVEAVMQDGNSGLRSIRYITTPGTLPPPPVKQAAPTNLRITAISPSEFTAEWDYPTDNNISFWSIAVRQLTSYSQTGVASSGRSFTYRDLQPSSGYEIILSGLDSNGVWTQEARLGFYSPAN